MVFFMEKGGIPPTGVYTMKETPARPLPHIGLRNLKTAPVSYTHLTLPTT